jgi:hypothetical protein
VSGLALDHVGVVGPDLAKLRAAFARLGFAPTAPKPLMRRDPATGRLEPLDQQSCHAVLQSGYLELSSVSSADAGHHLAGYASRAERLQILAIGVDDVEGARATSERNGLAVSPAMWAAREITYGERRGEARFHWFMIDAKDSPDGLVCFVRNHTPELVYQPEVTQHENGAIALVEVSILASDPAATANRYARALGLAPSGRGGDLCFALGGGVLRVTDAATHRERYGEDTGVTPDGFGLIGVEVADLGAAWALLASRGVPFRHFESEIVVPATAGCGAAVVLRARA